MCLGIPGQIIEISDPSQQMVKVDISGIQRLVNVACLVSDDLPIEKMLDAWVLVHVGFALSIIDEEEAQKTLALLAELGDMENDLDNMRMSEG